jgi:hypothetical protein
LGIVNKQNQANTSLVENLLHEIKAFLAWRAVKMDKLFIIELDETIVHGYGCTRLPVLRSICCTYICAHRWFVTDRTDSCGLTRANRSGKDNFIGMD